MSETPLVDALEAEMHSRMTTRLRIWKLARELERGQAMLRAKLRDVERELDEFRRSPKEKDAA